MAAIDDLKTWFDRDIKFATWAENVRVDDSDPGQLEVRFYTDTNEYVLTITPLETETFRVECVARARKPRAGLSAPRTRPLLRGPRHRLNERVWHRILAAIVGMELVRVHRPAEPEESNEQTAATSAVA
jgi:hypothetical protein